MSEKTQAMSEAELQAMVESSDTGGRNPKGFPARLITWTAIAWSLFQLYFCSKIPANLQGFLTQNGIDFNVQLDETKARSIHLAFALFLAFLSYPAFQSSPRRYIPINDWVLAIGGAFLGAFYFIFYLHLSTMYGQQPSVFDLTCGVLGMIVLLEATRRSLGLPLVVIAICFLIYNVAGPYLPRMFAHNSNTLAIIVKQQWLSSEGVFGVALGVSTKFVFLFVLFGALLDKAGAGNYFIKTAFSLLGHFRGGPAKAAVVASGLTGLISGSSIANVVTTGTFTIPMMRKVGFSAEKSGAVEVASSVNGQIMPPVMGAAAFLMVEYVGITYFEVVTHAIVPAVISYIALVYIVHLEAVKANMQGLERATQPATLLDRIFVWSTLLMFVLVVSFSVYFLLGWIKPIVGDNTWWVVGLVLLYVYLHLIWWCAKFPDLHLDDPNAPTQVLPKPKETVNSGLHFILPVFVLIWCLMVERLSSGLSAFYGTAVLIFILLTQKPLFAFFRRQKISLALFKSGWMDLLEGLETGARNMISIALATATAGIIVGVVAKTDLGAPLAAMVEQVSQGNILIMLLMVGLLSLILGMGLPTTANYIVVSSLLAGVIVEVGKQNGLVVPLIAVHLFVFYFGIMADVTPPVGLASFAAAAVSGGDPIKTGFIAFFYSLRTAILPFLFIFNTDLLLIDVTWMQGISVFIVATLAILVFTAATQRFFFDRCNWLEVVLLLLVAFTLFRPGYFMEKISPSTRSVPPSELVSALDKAPEGKDMLLELKGRDDMNDEIVFFATLPIEGKDGTARLEHLGLSILQNGDKTLVDNAEFDSIAQKAGLEFDQQILDVKLPASDALAKQWLYIPALAVLFAIAYLQRRRRARMALA